MSGGDGGADWGVLLDDAAKRPVWKGSRLLWQGRGGCRVTLWWQLFQLSDEAGKLEIGVTSIRTLTSASGADGMEILHGVWGGLSEMVVRSMAGVEGRWTLDVFPVTGEGEGESWRGKVGVWAAAGADLDGPMAAVQKLAASLDEA